MRNYINAMILSASAFLLLTGCAHNDVAVTYNTNSNNGVTRLETEINRVIWTKKESDDIFRRKCDFAYRTMALAKIAKKEGYDYFVIKDRTNGVSNSGGFAINSVEALNRYCHQFTYVDKSGLEKHKCYESTPIWVLNRAILLKQPSYLYPTWNVNRTINELRPMVAQCTDWDDMLPKSNVNNDYQNFEIAFNNLVKEQ